MPESPQQYITRIAAQRRKQRRNASRGNWVTATGGAGLSTADPFDAFIRNTRAQQEQQLAQRLGQDIQVIEVAKNDS